MMADQLETRTITADIEVREAPDSDGMVNIEGYATTFGQEYDMGAFREMVHPDAFTRTLSTNPDVRFLVDHAGQPLARTKSGTLALVPDTTGLLMRAKVDPADPDVQRLLPKMRRGDLDQMSFAFRVPAKGDEWAEDYGLRTLREVNISGGDVSVVTYPANPNTSVSVRSQDVRDAHLVLLQQLVGEMRSGTALSDAAMGQLATVLDALTGIATSTAEKAPASPLRLARARAALLSIPA